ncbi:MAG: cytochrome P450 [Thermoleophilaceae bacterium]
MASTLAEPTTTEATTEARPTSVPPGPPLPKLLQTLLVWSNPERFLGGCMRRYGHTFTVNTVEMGRLVYITREEDVKAVFTGDADVFHAGEGNAILKPVMGARSVLLLDGDEHLAQRKRMLPPFHGESVKRYRDVVARIAADEVERWPLDTPFAVHPGTTAIALEVILQAVIGVEHEERLDQLRDALRKLVHLTTPVLLTWIWEPAGWVGPGRRYKKIRAEADELLYDEIRRRRADPALDERQDVLSLLIREHGEAMSDRDLRDQLVTLLLAGHETTATGLAWAFERLSRNPRVLGRLEQAIAEDDDAYIDAVVKETLRSRPVIFDVIRKVKRPVEVAGHYLPEGVSVMPAIGLVQRDSKHFSKPDEFRPERFLEGEGGTYTWFPFGGGRRRCLGAAFASVEMQVVLRTVLSMRKLATTSAPAEPAEVNHITLVPRRGGRIALQRR